MHSASRHAETKPSCEGCFFGRQKLCALELDGPCATFRPDSPEGLRPQRQLRFAFRVADGLPATGLPQTTRRTPRRTPTLRPEQPQLAPGLFA